MDAVYRAELAGLLTERRAATEASLRAHRAEVRELLADRGDGTADDEHDPEGSTLSGEWAMREGIRVAEERELTEIAAAFERLEEGSFGLCATCGRAIPLGRLRARPTAVRCVPCADHAL